ncbi:MAG: alpha/beta hydrolase [Desulfarculaceae bacterium]|nr:alpha/beta hydrolase [Desulfarculaceae bacterium]MCF8073039.1 alpha/beta hydrolase [Desulfarculaceae bacterium]MCF8101876.1 alpha/beta hydrolase [Desulfarculaceae bacterium]MCF8115403.1 alpha/beta hydrolase [Desulfarculaceae bacterium]
MARPFDQLTPSLTRLGPPPEQARREVLFIHGAWGGAWLWEGLAEAVAEAGYGVSLMEQPGHGSDRWDLPWATSIKDYADLSRRAAAGLGQPVLVGHSLGGWQVQKIWEAVDLPGVLLAPLPGNGLPKRSLMRMMLQYPGPMLGASLLQPVAIKDAAMARRLFFHQMGEADIEEHVKHLVPEPARVCLEMAWGLAKARPGPGGQPRLLIAPELDYFFPPHRQKDLAEELGARFAMLHGLPHDLWLEDQEGRVLALLLEFLESLEG